MMCPSAPHPYPYLPSSLCSLLRDSLVAKLVRIHWQSRRPGFNSSVQKIAWRRDRLPISVCLDYPGGSAGKELTCSAEDLGSIPGLGRSPGEGKGYPLQYSGLDNSMNCVVHGAAKSWTGLSDFHFQKSKTYSKLNKTPNKKTTNKIKSSNQKKKGIKWK